MKHPSEEDTYEGEIRKLDPDSHACLVVIITLFGSLVFLQWGL